MTDITNIPTAEFPLNFERYNRLMDEIRDAARGFERLGALGWPGGKDLDKRLMEIRADLLGVWETIQETERGMRARNIPNQDVETTHPTIAAAHIHEFVGSDGWDDDFAERMSDLAARAGGDSDWGDGEIR
ncbi:hypothetical protein [Agrobacterium sp. El2ro-1b]|uniref:hypothetical protein n=1 Tax=Agrobacterium sp. El2ro-1b TaxID=2969528 RepID=UPI003AAB9422